MINLNGNKVVFFTRVMDQQQHLMPMCTTEKKFESYKDYHLERLQDRGIQFGLGPSSSFEGGQGVFIIRKLAEQLAS